MAKVIVALEFVFFLCVSLTRVDAQNGGFGVSQTLDACTTPDGLAGSCIGIKQCAPLLAVLRSTPLTQPSIEFLQRSQCGFLSKEPKVCCRVTNNVNNNPRDTNGNGQISVNLRNNPLLPEDCGRDLSLRIVGGEITELDEFPWMVLLEYQKPTGYATACGGVLISRRYVVTAAHCIKGKALPRTWTLRNVRLGEYDTSTDRDCVDDGDNSRRCSDEPVTISIEEQIAHEQYRPNSRDQRYDIALIRLSRDVAYTNYIKPICLPSNLTFPQKLFVAGWGKTETKSESNVKLKLSLSVADMDACREKYRNARVDIGDGQICAGGQRGKDSCRGDSGGPLMSVERTPEGYGRWTAVGIVSFGPSPCGMQGWPGVYTKIIDYVPWIVSKIRP